MSSQNHPTEHERLRQEGADWQGNDEAKDPVQAGEEKAREARSALESAGRSVKREMSRPIVAGAVTGVVALGAAVTFGALPTAVGGGAVYIVYRELKKRQAAEG